VTSTLNVWLIDEGHTGHRVQSEGVLMALSRAGLKFDITKVECDPTLRGFLRPAARAAMAQLKGRRALEFAKRIARFENPDGAAPAFIISSGGRSAFVSRALAVSTGAPNVFVGNPAPFPVDWFTAIMAPVPLSKGEAILTGIVPNVVTRDECAKQAQAYWHGAPPPDRWTLLIGGASRSHLYDEADWRDLAEAVNALSTRHGVKWLISTSRRTGEKAEAILKANILPEALGELVVYGQEPKRVVLPFLGAGERIFVTRDSLTMVSEAIMSARPVTAVLPRHCELDPSSDMAAILSKYRSWDQYDEISCAGLAAVDPAPGANLSTPHRAGEELDAAAHELAKLLRLDIPKGASFAMFDKQQA